MRTILVTGGLGYIGTELCKLYKNSQDEVIVIDNKFVPHRVAWLNENNIKYYQINVINDDRLKSIVGNADIIYHLAGITDVAYTKTEENSPLNELIWDVGVNGTNNILDYMNKDSKLIFPSTHVVFEGYKETKHNLKEDDRPEPELMYSKTKFINEKDIQKKCNNYVILRLGSVHGYNENMRLKIVPNLFSKMTSQNETLKLFGGGKQHKSVVPVQDVARCMKFMAESDIRNELFHLSNENLTIKELAEKCNKIKKCDMIETNDEIPNLGYTLDNSKLLSTEFEFEYNLDKNLNDMIMKWSIFMCDLCKKNSLKIFLDLGKQPLANKYPTKEQISDEKKYPLQVCFCENCKNVQLSYKVSRSVMFEDYYYLSSVNQELVRYFESLAEEIKDSNFVVDIGSNDGILLRPLKKMGVRCLGVDPSVNVGKLANEEGLETLISFFNEETANKIVNDYGKPDVIVCSSTFTHLDNPHDFIKNAKKILAENGKLIIEVEYIGNFIKNIHFERFYLDRIFYYSLTSLKKLFEQYDMKIMDVEEIEPHGGCLKVIIKNFTNEEPTERVKQQLIKEENELTTNKMNNFKDIVQENIELFKNKLLDYKKQGLKIGGYGCPARFSTITNYGDIDESLIPYTVDDSPLKQGKFTPGKHIPIVSKEYLEEQNPDIVVVFAYEYFNDIKNKLNKEYRFLFPIPPREIE